MKHYDRIGTGRPGRREGATGDIIGNVGWAVARVKADEERAGTGRIIQHVVVFVSVALTLLAMTFFVLSVDRQLDRMGEVRAEGVGESSEGIAPEFRKFEIALLRANEAGAGPVRVAFGNFNESLMNSVLVMDARAGGIPPDARESIAAVKDFLRRAGPVVGGADAEIMRAAGDISRNMKEIRGHVVDIENRLREISSRRLDVIRGEITSTLVRLAGFVAVLLISLLMMTIYLSWQGRLVLSRARREARMAKYLEAIIDSSQDGVVVTDTAGAVKTFGKSAIRLFDRSPETVEGRDFSSLLGLSGKSFDDIRSGCLGGVMEINVITPSGKAFPAEISSRRERAFGEEVVVFFVRDISHRKAIEQELRKARDEALAGREAKANFVAVMSHEIRTPLNGIMGIMDLLSDTPLDDEQKRLLENMEVSGRILLSHLNNVLDITRSDAGQLALAPRAASIGAVISDVVQSQSDAASRKGNILSGEVIPPDDFVYRFDPDRLRQVLVNLVGNAQKFTSSGEIRVEVERLCRKEDRDTLEIRVSDTGSGIPEDKIETVFRDFETLDTSYSRSQSGAGLGLGIVRRIVEAMDGIIDVDSLEGCGTQFTIHLEMERAEKPDDPESPSPGKERGPILRRSVLVVEDNDINRDVIRKSIEKFGGEVDVAENGHVGVLKADEKPYDIIFMDIGMPVLDGVEATRRIRQGSGLSKESVIIATTADMSFSERGAVDHAGFTGILTKPFSREVLEGLLAEEDIPADVPAGGGRRPGGAVLDDRIIDELREDLGEDSAERLLTDMMKDASNFIDWLDDAGSVDEIGLRAHSVAGAAGTCGASELCKSFRQVEELARSEGRLPSRPMIRNCFEIWKNALGEMRRAGFSINTPDRPSGSSA